MSDQGVGGQTADDGGWSWAIMRDRNAYVWNVYPHLSRVGVSYERGTPADRKLKNAYVWNVFPHLFGVAGLGLARWLI